MAERPGWTLLTTHGAVWVLVAREGAITAEHLAQRLGIAVRSVQRVLRDLEQAGYLVKHKEGRRNRYEVLLDKPMRHRGLRTLPVGEVLGAFLHRHPRTPP
jgi:DNA-binding transcriptional ArsR family regulator